MKKENILELGGKEQGRDPKWPKLFYHFYLYLDISTLLWDIWEL